jgi:hypothetical protein
MGYSILRNSLAATVDLSAACPLTSGCTCRRVWGIGVVTGSVIGFGCLQFSIRFAAQVSRDPLGGVRIGF